MSRCACKNTRLCLKIYRGFSKTGWPASSCPQFYKLCRGANFLLFRLMQCRHGGVWWAMFTHPYGDCGMPHYFIILWNLIETQVTSCPLCCFTLSSRVKSVNMQWMVLHACTHSKTLPLTWCQFVRYRCACYMGICRRIWTFLKNSATKKK